MTQAVLELEVGFRSSNIRELERLLGSLSGKGIKVDPSYNYLDLKLDKNGFKTLVRFQPYENGVPIREDGVCRTLLDDLRVFADHENVLSYTLRRNNEAAGCYAKIR